MQDETGRQFVDLSNPHCWWLTAESFHDQAVIISKNRGTSSTFFLNSDNKIEKISDNVDKTLFLLAALALENQIKALLVYEFPQWVSNGRLSKKLKNHNLLELRSLSNFAPYRAKNIKFFRILQEGVESWARYPCGLTWETSHQEPALNSKIWQSYLRIYLSQDRRIKSLLAKGWQGPHGFFGSWTFATY